MGKVLIGIGAVVAASAVVVAALYFKGDLFHGSPPARQSHWVVAPPRPRSGNRARAMAQYSLTKEFGPWRLTCTQQATQQATTPKVGFIQNLGIVPSGKGKPLPCQVSIRMQDEAAPGQTMSLGFRYRAGSANPDVFAFYMTLGRPNVLYTPTGQVVDLDKENERRILHGAVRIQESGLPGSTGAGNPPAVGTPKLHASYNALRARALPRALHGGRCRRNCSGCKNRGPPPWSPAWKTPRRRCALAGAGFRTGGASPAVPIVAPGDKTAEAIALPEYASPRGHGHD